MGLRRILSPRASRVYKFRYENPDFLMESGKPHYREITAVAGEGRGKVGSEAEARDLADRRLSEQYGQALLDREQRVREGNGNPAQAIPGYEEVAAQRLRADPRLHQDNYVLVGVQRVK
jgi:hypothetical protein